MTTKTCWCGAEPTYLQEIDICVTPWDEETRAPNGQPGAFKCDDHTGDSFGNVWPIGSAIRQPMDAAHIETRTSPFGYYATCPCGHISRGYFPTAREAYYDLADHHRKDQS